jgi:hypothetical protein
MATETGAAAVATVTAAEAAAGNSRGQATINKQATINSMWRRWANNDDNEGQRWRWIQQIVDDNVGKLPSSPDEDSLSLQWSMDGQRRREEDRRRRETTMTNAGGRRLFGSWQRWQVVWEEGGGRRAQDRMIDLKQTSNNQQHATAMGGGGDGRRRTKTMTAAAIAAAMAEEAVGWQRLRRWQGRGNSGGDGRGGDKGKTAAGQVLPLAVSYVAEQYYLANSGDILASFLASVYK